jgi:HAD superfamily hydrolase (TIGR01549 family)
MRFDCYLFDLDNSLLEIPNPSEYFDDVLVGTLNKFSLKKIPDFNERNKLWKAGEEYLNILKKWGITDSENFWKYFDEIDYIKRKKLIKGDKLNFFPDVLDVLNKLNSANKKMAIISNTADYIIEYVLNKLNYESFFHETFGLGYDKNQSIAKPSPEGIKLVLKKLEIDPKSSNAIMIGDSIVDILAAKRANIQACLIRRNLDKYPEGYDKWEYPPDYIIEKLDDLFKL